MVDKDRNPRWKPATLAEVTGPDVEAYFAPLGGRELNLTPKEKDKGKNKEKNNV